MQEVRQPRIVVVGAGAAGFNAAAKLNQLGFTDVTLLGKNPQIGGRFGKAQLENVWDDPVFQFFHGAFEKKQVNCILEECGLLSQVPKEGKSIFYRCNEQKVEEDFSKHVYEAGGRIIKYFCSSIGKSIGEHYEENAKEFIEMHRTNEKMVARGILSSAGDKFSLNISGLDLHDMSLASWEYYLNMGQDINVEGHMFHIVRKLMNDIPKGSLLLDKAVSKIKWDSSFTGKEGRKYPVCVVCEDDDEILADHVIFTMSLGYLKAQATTLFNPSLPAGKREAIVRLGFGNIGKIFLKYEEAFWENDVIHINFIWDDDCVISVRPDQARLLKHLQLFTVMRPKEKFGDVLIAWCPSDVADLIGTMSEKDLSTAITEQIRMFTGNPHIPPPKAVLSTQWRSNCFKCGVCSFLPVGVDALVMDVLAQPLVGNNNPSKAPQVLFAGEATMKSLYGTVQGALISGHREADRLLQYYKETSPTLSSATHT